MIGMAYFFRNVNSIDELKEKTASAMAEKKRLQKYRVLEKICLNEEEYVNFQNSFIKTYAFINNITFKLTMNSSAEYLCALVLASGFKYGILVNSSGHSYARTVAIIELGEDYGI